MRPYREEFLTIAEVAERLKLNEQTIRNWISAGKLPAYHVGRRVRISRSDFDTLVHGGADPAQPAVTPDRAQMFWDGTFVAEAVAQRRSRSATKG